MNRPIKYHLATFKLDGFVGTAARTHNIRLKEIKKRRALFGNQTVELLMNSVGKRTVVLQTPSFFYFFNPFFVIRNLIYHPANFNRQCIERTFLGLRRTTTDTALNANAKNKFLKKKPTAPNCTKHTFIFLPHTKPARKK